MPAYLIQADTDLAGRTSVAGANGVVVVASNPEDALAMAKGQFSGNTNDAWDAADLSVVESPKDVAGFSLNVSITNPEDGELLVSHEVVGEEGETLDDLGRRMARELTAGEVLNGAAYNSMEHVLTLASPAGGDAIGDHIVRVWVMPPNATNGRAVEIPGFVRSVVDQGDVGASLLAVLADASYVLPLTVVTFSAS